MAESSTTETPLPAALGEVIGAYRLTEIIGRGGTGCVYRGVHETLGRTAAIKVMHPWVAADSRYTARLELEAKLVNGLQHPNIVDIIDFVQTEEPVRVACVMELLEGPSLAQVIAEQTLHASQALHMAYQLADALAAVHAQGIVHRDITPSNIIVNSMPAGRRPESHSPGSGQPEARSAEGCPDTKNAPRDADFGSRPSVKLLDFGTAKVTDRSVSERTLSAVVVGTPAYMAPEQLAAEEATSATDVYGLMEVLVEMLTHRRLFADVGLAMMREKLAGVSRIPLPETLVGRPALEALLVAGLRADPEERPWLDEIRPRLRHLAGLQPPAAP